MSETLLNDVFAQFTLAAKVVGVRKGPSVSRYEVELGRGTSVRDLTKIMPDVARICGTENARLISPLSNGLVAIELPREGSREILEWYDLMGYEDVRDTLDLGTPLSFLLGAEMALDADQANEGLLRTYGMELNPVTADLAKLPHLLVAGATDSGKSVFINTLLCSILSHNSPSRVQMVLIDPKKVELSAYAELPHLAYPLVTEAEEAKKALEFVVDEMDARYLMTSRHGVRNIAEFNSAVAEGKINEKPVPMWLVVIDELADLMMVAKRDVEKSIVRITQLAGAAGIHLVVATQYPSVDVITGLIKANMPSRLAFAVASKTDSRLILDQMGAESLTGMGDALFVPQGSRNAQRIQCAYIDAEEVEHEVYNWLMFPEKTISADKEYQDYMARLRFAVENNLPASAPMVERMFGVDAKATGSMSEKFDTPEATL